MDNRKLSMEELGRNSTSENHKAAKRPITVVLDNIRSGLNVGSVLRSSDAFGVNNIILCGISAQPPDRQVLKSALGADRSVNWTYEESTFEAIQRLKENHEIVLIEQTMKSIPLNNYRPSKEKPTAVVLGNELKGVSDEILPLADICLEIPQMGHKHSLNVAVCAGIVLWEINRLSGT
jgi:tRNA G18 (ribose-2'-O)-methylase SpoU